MWTECSTATTSQSITCQATIDCQLLKQISRVTNTYTIVNNVWRSTWSWAFSKGKIHWVNLCKISWRIRCGDNAVVGLRNSFLAHGETQGSDGNRGMLNPLTSVTDSAVVRTMSAQLQTQIHNFCHQCSRTVGMEMSVGIFLTSQSYGSVLWYSCTLWSVDKCMMSTERCMSIKSQTSRLGIYICGEGATTRGTT